MKNLTLIQIGEKYAVKFRPNSLCKWRYIDVTENHQFYWLKNSEYFRDCLTSKEQAEKLFISLTEEIIIKKN